MRSAELLQLPLDQDTDPAAGIMPGIEAARDEDASFAGDSRQGRDSVSSARLLQQQAADRLAAHRLRRGLPHAGNVVSIAPSDAQETRPTEATRSSRIASAVAERYAQSQSYRDFLAAEAQRAMDEANAAAEVATRSARAIAAAQQQLIADLEARSQHEVAESAAVQPAEADPQPIESIGAAEDMYLWPDAAICPAARANVARPTATRGTAAKPAAAHHGPESPKSDSAEDLFASVSLPESSHSDLQPAALAAFGETASALAVRHYEPAVYWSQDLAYRTGVPRYNSAPAKVDARYPVAAQTFDIASPDEEALALDEEIAFRQAPVFDEPPAPVVPIPGNLLEFPRQLVAARKARPLLAEGPLRPASESREAPDSGGGQLRIFEVAPSQISSEPPLQSILPEWSSIHLDAPAGLAHDHFALASADRSDEAFSRQQAYRMADVAIHAEAHPGAETATRPELHTAPLSLRAMAATVDLSLVLIGGLVLIAVAAIVSGTVPVGAPAAESALGIFFALFVLYQALFFTFSECTPGMRYARIALCTFTDENPTRRAMRLRVPALVLSICPAALGLAWVWLDPDRLTLHDRLTRMYQRSY